MVAFATSLILSLAGFAAVIAYGKRRPIGASLSWGEAIAGATLAFFLMFFAYGVVPHQWLTYANNELGWLPNKTLVSSGQFELPTRVGWNYPPLTVSYETVSHLIVVGIYGLFLGMHVAIWSIWQDRAKPKPAEIATSEYGRPLVKQG